MQPFTYCRAAPTSTRALAAAQRSPDAEFIAGGTDLLQLMKDGVEQPDPAGRPRRPAARSTSRSTATGVGIGALVRMSDVADHPRVRAGAIR